MKKSTFKAFCYMYTIMCAYNCVFQLSIAKATTEHFPELLCQFEDLGIKSLLVCTRDLGY